MQLTNFYFLFLFFFAKVNRDLLFTLGSGETKSFDICLKIRSDYPVDLVSELLTRELPVIGEKNSLILKGPVFEGITKIEDGMMTLSIETECREADTHKVKLYVYGELQKLFAKNGIRI